MIATQHITYNEYCDYVLSQGRTQVLPRRLWDALKKEAVEGTAQKEWVCEADNMVGEEYSSGPITYAESSVDVFHQGVTLRWSHIRAYKKYMMPHIQ
tara:strand:+ start:17889 stop:18179 length:291 start_codon:yes stop_codon:yes gene_type:complete